MIVCVYIYMSQKHKEHEYVHGTCITTSRRTCWGDNFCGWLLHVCSSHFVQPTSGPQELPLIS